MAALAIPSSFALWALPLTFILDNRGLIRQGPIEGGRRLNGVARRGSEGSVERQRAIHGALSYPESPLCDGARVYLVEYGAHALTVVDLASGERQVIWQRSGFGPAAVARAGDGSFWLTGSDSDRLLCLDAQGLPKLEIDRDRDDRTFEAPNDLVFDDRGGLYFTASGTFSRTAPIAGCVFYHQLGGATWCVASGIHYANGVALSADRATLFVAEHLRNRVLAYPIAADRSLGLPRVFVDLARLAPLDCEEPLLGPDGLAVTNDGRLLIAHFGGARLLVLDAAAELQQIVELSLRYPTNVCTGSTPDTVYVTAIGENVPPHRGALIELELR